MKIVNDYIQESREEELDCYNVILKTEQRLSGLYYGTFEDIPECFRSLEVLNVGHTIFRPSHVLWLSEWAVREVMQGKEK